MTDPTASELDMQRRWAESRWPVPFLQSPAGGAVRVISPGVWNRGPGPDFRGAQILDSEGRARRGDVELHLRASAWLQHGHADDPAYRNLLLHIVEWDERPRRSNRPIDARIPPATPLPPATSTPLEAPPCAGIAQRAGAAAVEARLLQIARRRFQRKVAELRAIAVPPGPGCAEDRLALIAAARALGQPHNAAIVEGAARQALEQAEGWDAVQPLITPQDWRQGCRRGWRRGRGALGAPEGLQLVLTTLLQRWTADGSSPRTAFERLASLPLREAIGNLRISQQLGPARATQLLADAVYPLTDSWLEWSRLPGARYQRTAELRARLDGEPGGEGVGFAWRHPQTQALLELEQTRCRQWACRICPLAALARPLRTGGEDGRP